jgi:ParB family chromosome partitioning protein
MPTTMNLIMMKCRDRTGKEIPMPTNEWFTPPKYIQAARQVLGEVDLDPASCLAANQIVKARQIYTKEENGLLFPWSGRVWLNPPYGRTVLGRGSLLEHFTRHLVEQYQCGHVTEAIALLPANTATRWFDHLWQYPICFPRFRIRFLQEDGSPSRSVTFGTCFVYLGQQEVKFSEVFARFGHIVKAVDAVCVRPVARGLWREPQDEMEEA